MTRTPQFKEIQAQLLADAGLFNEKALEVFHYQLSENKLYGSFVKSVSKNYDKISHYSQIPFLPISFFKTHPIASFDSNFSERVYSSSGTTGAITSRHFVKNYLDYENSFLTGFELLYGPVENLCILALLPSYTEREGSSLVEMVKVLMDKSGHSENGFYLKNTTDLIQKIEFLRNNKQKCLIIGVTFALLDLAESGPYNWNHVTIMETGGMKGKRKEMIRPAVHEILQQQFGISTVHSEYGMTEMLSQGYSTGNGIFCNPPWLKMVARDVHDPLSTIDYEKTGGLNVIDLANIHSCSFIATQDLGKVYEDGTYEVLGRFDNSDVRGCNLMIS